MDRLKRRRAPLRATITKTVNDIDEELEKDPPDQEVLNLKLNKLGRLLTEVGDLDQKVKDAMLDADCTDAEYEAEINVIQD